MIKLYNKHPISPNQPPSLPRVCSPLVSKLSCTLLESLVEALKFVMPSLHPTLTLGRWGWEAGIRIFFNTSPAFPVGSKV